MAEAWKEEIKAMQTVHCSACGAALIDKNNEGKVFVAKGLIRYPTRKRSLGHGKDYSIYEYPMICDRDVCKDFIDGPLGLAAGWEPILHG
jgi:hypothetical protein